MHMKKIIITSILSLLLFVSAHGVQAESSAFTVSLNVGSKNSTEVTRLQKFLVAQGLLTATPNGHYGPATKKAVQAFQKNNGIQSTGFFGPLTRKVASSLGGGTQTVALKPATIAVVGVKNSSNGMAASVVLSSTKVITWQTVDYPANVGVNINLLRQTSNSPITYSLIRTLAKDTPNDGTESFVLKSGETGSDVYAEVACSSTYKFKQECKLSSTPFKVN